MMLFRLDPKNKRHQVFWKWFRIRHWRSLGYLIDPSEYRIRMSLPSFHQEMKAQNQLRVKVFRWLRFPVFLLHWYLHKGHFSKWSKWFSDWVQKGYSAAEGRYSPCAFDRFQPWQFIKRIQHSIQWRRELRECRKMWNEPYTGPKWYGSTLEDL